MSRHTVSAASIYEDQVESIFLNDYLNTWVYSGKVLVGGGGGGVLWARGSPFSSSGSPGGEGG